MSIVDICKRSRLIERHRRPADVAQYAADGQRVGANGPGIELAGHRARRSVIDGPERRDETAKSAAQGNPREACGLREEPLRHPRFACIDEQQRSEPVSQLCCTEYAGSDPSSVRQVEPGIARPRRIAVGMTREMNDADLGR